jgi:regulator of cell morphogenesis and NO signaling
MKEKIMKLSKTTVVGQLAAQYPETTRVFDQYQIDFCCGGGHTLQAACEKLALDIEKVQAALQAVLERGDTHERVWADAKPAELIPYILETYHKPLKIELVRLEKMMNKVVKVHSDKAPEMLPALQEVFAALKTELDQHLIKEEQILFPMILSGNIAMAACPIARMRQEHEIAGDALKRMRELTHDYAVPTGACNTWRALWHGLSELEKDLHRHIHLENNVLFLGCA